LVETENTPEQDVCKAAEDKSNQNADEPRNRRSRLRARRSVNRKETERFATAKGKAA
jgi:hypothetical protein